MGLLLWTGGAAVFAAPRHDVDIRSLNPRLDGAPVVVENPIDGRAWSAWAYRTGGEYDVAISVRDGAGTWSAPEFLVRYDHADQRDPSLAVDERGTVYLAYADEGTGRVAVFARTLSASQWLPVGSVGGPTPAALPSLTVEGNRLLVAYVADGRIRFERFDLVADDPVATRGIDDGPDPFGNRSLPLIPPGGDNPRKKH